MNNKEKLEDSSSVEKDEILQKIKQVGRWKLRLLDYYSFLFLVNILNIFEKCEIFQK